MNFPIDAWPHEVKRGFEFYDQTERTDLERPNLYDTIAYFAQQAPGRESFLGEVRTIPSNQPLQSRFKLFEFAPDRKNNSVANVEFMGGAEPGFVACDARDGHVYFHPSSHPEKARILLRTSAPINSTICDLDQDGQTDIMVSDIGDYEATDSQMGKIIWLQKNGKEFKQTEIAANLGRVCQTLVNDFNGDGFNDILVAEFGYFKTGSVFLLQNDGTGFSGENFSRTEIDSRHGTVRLQAFDFNNDGHLDFAAVIAQEHETVELFINDGKANFESKSIFAAGYPSYGSSGIDLVDMDNDGDIDVLYTNGDTFDSMVPKKYHSIQWLENQGNLEFEHRHITHMPGVHCARAADFDRDGDLDIVACAFMSDVSEEIEFDSIVYLENKGANQFEKYWIEKNEMFYPNLQIGDFNSDGRVDFVAGTGNLGVRTECMPLKIYLGKMSNQGISEKLP